MGVRDALLLNLTSSNFEALQQGETARIKGDLSIQKQDGTEVLGIDASAGSFNVTGNITGSVNISSSVSSTGSFGRVVATTFHGDGSQIRDTLPRSVGILTSSAQIAAAVTGAFFSGFEFSSSISGSVTTTGSFARLEGDILSGDGIGIRSTLPRTTGIITSSAQVAQRISGSFNKGFNISGDIKGASVTGNGTWSAGGALSNAIDYHAVAGDKSGAISAMGTAGSWPTGYFAVPAGINTDCNEEYNGTSWSEANDNNTARARSAAAGNVNAGLFFGGLTTVWYGASTGATETYNGTNWSEVNDMIIPRRAHMGAGTQNSALAIGGYKDTSYNPTDNPAATSTMDCNVELWNGTNWSNNGQAPASLRRGAAAGTINTTIVFGTSTQKTETYQWDGSSWSEGGAHPARSNVGGGGSSNDGISFGGQASGPNRHPAETATYDGTTWSAAGDMIQTLAYPGMGANQQAASTAIAVGGPNSPTPYAGSTYTEEYTGGTAIISGSFGRLVADSFHGDASNLQSSLPYSTGLVTGSAQLASRISGSFNKGFNFTGTISGSATSTGSFGRIDATSFHGDGSGVASTLPRPTGLVSGSAQLASRISGSFNKGFGFEGTISGSATSTGSFGSIVSALKGPGEFMAGSIPGMVSSSAQIASQISGSFTKGFNFNPPSLHTASFFSGVSGSQFHGVAPYTLISGSTMWNPTDGSGSYAYHGVQIYHQYASSSQFGSDYNPDLRTDYMRSRIIGGQLTGVWSTDIPLLSTCYHQNAGAHGIVLIPTPSPSVPELSSFFAGDSYVQGPNLPSPSRPASAVIAGNQSAGIIFHGWNHNNCESFLWDGVAFNDGPDSTYSGNYLRGASAGTGTQNSAIGYLNNNPPSPYQGVDSFDGTSWTQGPELNTHRYGGGMSGGSNNDALYFGGQYGPSTTDDGPLGCPPSSAPSQWYQTEKWDGTTWSQVAAMIRPKRQPATGGTTSSTMAVGSQWTNEVTYGCPEEFNGETWRSLPEPTTKTTGLGFGTVDNFRIGNSRTNAPSIANCMGVFEGWYASGSYLHAGKVEGVKLYGDATNIKDTVSKPTGLVSGSAQLASSISGSFNKGFDYKGAILQTKDAGTWTRITNRNEFIAYAGQGGTVNATAVFGGVCGGRQMQAPSFTENPTSYEGCTEKWNGSSWSESHDMILGRAVDGWGSTSDALLAAGGKNATGNSGYQATTEEYNGSSWSEINDMNNARDTKATGFTTEEGIAAGGGWYYNRYDIRTETWDGTSWTNQAPADLRCATNMSSPTPGYWGPSFTTLFGGSNAATLVGGCYYAKTKCTRFWNGSSWTAGPDKNMDGYGGFGGGTQNAGITSGGHCVGGSCFAGNQSSCTEIWNGTSWVVGPSLIVAADFSAGGSNTAMTSITAGGKGYYGTQPTVADYVRAQNRPTMTDFGDSPAVLPHYTCYYHSDASTYEGAIPHTGSFGRVEADFLVGDASGISQYFSRPTGLVTGSKQLASYISGAFTSGFEFSGTISGSKVSASFGKISSDFAGDGTSLTASLSSSIVTVSSAGAYISGAFAGDIRASNIKSSIGAGVFSFGPDLVAYGRTDNRSAGSLNAMATVGGDVSGNPPSYTGGNPAHSTHEQYDGTSWSWSDPMLRCGGGDSSPGQQTWGTANSFGAAGRNQGGTTGKTEIWNGTSWSEVNDLITARGLASTSGCTVDDAIFANGLGSDNSQQHCCAEQWNGTNWSEITRTIRNLGNNGMAGGTSNAFFMPPAYASNTNCTEIWNGNAWSNDTATPYTPRYGGQGGDGDINNFVFYGAGSGYWGSTGGSFWDGTAWSDGPNELYLTRNKGGRGFGGGQGGPSGMFMGGSSHPGVGLNLVQILDANTVTTASFGHVKAANDVVANSFQVSGSTLKLPMFTDLQLNYWDREAEQSTGSLSGSVCRVADVDVTKTTGNFWFNSDMNALGYTYLSSSVYSQSIDFKTCYYESASHVQTASTGYITQSHYCYYNVVCYITGSYT